MNPPPLQVLYEDNHLLAVVKPAGLPTMGTPGGHPTLLTLAKEHVKRRYRKPGNVYLGVMSRLDAPVTGIVLLARTSKAAARLTEQFRGRAVEKKYWAIAEGLVEPAAGNLMDWLGQDERHRRMHIVGPTLAGERSPPLLSAVGGGSGPYVPRGRVGDRQEASNSAPVGQPWPSDHRRSEVRQRRALSRRHRAARLSAGHLASDDRRGWSSRPRCRPVGGGSASEDAVSKPQRMAHRLRKIPAKRP